MGLSTGGNSNLQLAALLQASYDGNLTSRSNPQWLLGNRDDNQGLGYLQLSSPNPPLVNKDIYNSQPYIRLDFSVLNPTAGAITINPFAYLIVDQSPYSTP